MEGACVPSLDATDAGTDSGPAPPSTLGVDLDNLAEVEPIDWSEPIAVAPLEPTITGGDARLLGTWLQADCDPADPPRVPPHGCVRVALERDGSGVFGGVVVIERTAAVEGALPPLEPAPAGGYPPPTDPDVGYPTWVETSAFLGMLWNVQAGFPYRLLDGRFEDDRLSFAWSTTDLWHEWCAMQSPHAWRIDDHAFSFCVPQDRSLWQDIDEGKLVLCTTADFEPLCGTPEGELLPCPCIEDSARCSPAFCHCDEAGCDSDDFGQQVRAQLSVQGNMMVGGWTGPAGTWSGTLVRVDP